MSHLGDRIAERLKIIGKRPADLARATGSSRASVSDWMSGKTKEIKGHRLIKAAQFLQVSPEWLATGKPPKNRQGSSVGEESPEYQMDDEMRALIRQLNKLPKKSRKALLEMIASLINGLDK